MNVGKSCLNKSLYQSGIGFIYLYFVIILRYIAAIFYSLLNNKQGVAMAYAATHNLTVVMAGAPAPFSFAADEKRSLHAAKAANENLLVKADWMTPAEALQAVLKIKQKLLLENYLTFSLFHSAARRKVWDEVNACEQCLRWMYFRNLAH